MKLQFYCTKSKYDLSFEVSKTLKPLAELKVEKKQKKSTLHTSEDTQMEEVVDATALEEESEETSGWH